MNAQPKFKPVDKTEFYRVLRDRVQTYFQETHQPTTATTAMKVRAFVLISLWIGVYLLLILANTSLTLNYVLWVSLGFLIPLVTVNVGHDAIHGSFTKKPWLKSLLSHTFNFNGASAYMWEISHNVAHHTFTNVHGHDEDISPAPFIRISPGTPLLKVHKYQHFYSFFFYGLATISWLFAKDYKQFFSNHIANYSNQKHPKKEYFYLFFYKGICYTLFIILPLILIPHSWGHIVAGFFIMQFIAGYYLSIIFMLAHGVEEVHFSVLEDEPIIQKDWAIHQMCTTANFSTTNRLAAFLTGGLNQQIEHHLFPMISSVHYTRLSGIVKETAHEFGVPYLEIPTFFKAIKSHIRFLYRIGHEENYQPKMAS